MNKAVSFLQKVNGDHQLQALINSANWDVNTVTRIAANYGYVFSARELRLAMDELWGNLSEEDLSVVAGGNEGRDGKGRVEIVNPPPGQGGAYDSGTWSPPPGDVSGNSCFFGWKGSK
jgi:predicted ribosomally synthesized peptide with nif11-like leader